MKFDFFTIFPSLYGAFLNESLIGKAARKGILSFRVFDMRDYSSDPHKKVDDYSYGGGAGMVLRADVVLSAFRKVYGDLDLLRQGISDGRISVIVPSARGKKFTQATAWNLSKREHIIFVSPRYEGVDQRVVEDLRAEELSVGDFVVMGGDLPAMLMTEAIVRLVPGVVGKSDSLRSESFSGEGLLEYPQYTRPYEVNGYKVPDVLLSGNHKAVDVWRRKQAILTTFKNRPDILLKLVVDGKISLREVREALSDD